MSVEKLREEVRIAEAEARRPCTNPMVIYGRQVRVQVARDALEEAFR